MPRAVKSDATALRGARTTRHIPRADSVVEADLAQDGSTTDVEEPSFAPSLGQFMAPLRPAGYLGSRQDIQTELDAIAYSVRSFPLKQPDQVLRECSAYSARLTELTVLLHRAEDYDRQYTRVRTMQVAKWLEELERQWKTASRLIEVARQDLELLR